MTDQNLAIIALKKEKKNHIEKQWETMIESKPPSAASPYSRPI